MKTLRNCAHFLSAAFIGIILPTSVHAETVGIFFDPEVKQIQFAASDVKAALEKKDFTVEVLPLDALNPEYANKMVVITLVSNESVRKSLETLGAAALPKLGSQAYGMRTTNLPQKSYWVIGGDANGAMDGGLQLAEDRMYHGMTMARTLDLPNWHAHDASVLKEFTDLGGILPAFSKKKLTPR